MSLVVYDFMDMLNEKLTEDERLLFAGFPGDPYDNASWAMCTYTQNTRFFDQHNLYFCVSSSKKNERGEWRRKKENFGRGLVLMIDDLGDGKGSKNPMSVIDKLEPTLLVETSPGNTQAMYVFKEPVADIELFEGLINAFIAKNFLDGKDPGQRGVNRVARLPYGINGKKKYGGWKVVAKNYRPENQYTPEQLIEAFDLTIVKRRPWDGEKLLPSAADIDRRVELFRMVYRFLLEHSMLKKDTPDLGGKIPMTCPWVDDHTDSADSGSYLAVPSEENGFCGSFVCYHSSTHNDQTGWGKLLAWVIQYSPEVRALLEQQEQDIATQLEKANQSCQRIF